MIWRRKTRIQNVIKLLNPSIKFLTYQPSMIKLKIEGWNSREKEDNYKNNKKKW